jgi:hypothetical protein
VANFNRTQTGLDILKAVCGRLGLPQPASTNDTATSTQLWYLLTECGRKLMQDYRWQALSATWELTTTPPDTEYPLPQDFNGFLDSSAWNTTSRLPMLIADDAQWATLVARNLGISTISIVYRTRGNTLELYEPPSVAQSLILDYGSRGWVQANGDPATLKDWMELADDQCRLDPELVTSYLKLRFLEEKGFDTFVATRDFNIALETAKNRDSDAPILTPGVAGGTPLINVFNNLPDTGLGS